jgi:hypothetical protein
MQVYTKTEELAKQFDAVYPKELPARLHWWRTALAIDPARFLRLIGMSARRAAERKKEDLKDILKNPRWEENARLVEGRLHRLLALFHYDWHALAERLHGPVVHPVGEKSSPETRRNKGNKRLRDIPNGADDIPSPAPSGTPWFSDLFAYLTAPPTGGGRAKS